MTFDEIKRRGWVATYPSREAALALVEWIKGDDWERASDLDKRLAGVGIEWTASFHVAAERCFEVYGCPELEAGACARRLAEVSMRPSKASSTSIAAPADTPASPPRDAYGFTRRA
ncbi:hypothetical protein [Mesorhizobium sp.]|jgi:hypothetical protein|uniref:hypothetical protein n=1 Tax=Mesorhizobium sp. TaxID=1871066 RepID=UPI0011FE3EC9|nr:hypothetical protein [Mesorhizobium sp.]TIM09554.1 MAG: hypothetical protein E5Y67_27315 [Mesorhizobium sp.]TIM43744.1 MAG: hypothetical protein E5Y56_17255 [Mesorhizobium sp.]